ncbi:tRNA U34 5-methylaminomethyl-2-thiouridine-forming methyltransferase MnmC [Algoriphagus iocasae]|uniref:tRNA U34 5-methylaminomethyl-2-thiouridine-forming methyltransferase MnmC n=1 Tax=Algoriphagus iocasae TaxID=1836499 RepID=A0A841MNN3_9BACT|nr:tRNA (5-methylaminomethyl-2-thiouridine)(34)-methyltransferase MnmD [Algoriphagus iocasae]MBB6327129.1 tRNA U34 5-methylaminomethyl-2-thiouridine-forming methyltransferase MnmC [Algoriphagus iocasae]
MSEKLKIILTEDGSHSLYNEDLKETYHSFHGALKESVHVFMLYGLDSWLMENPTKKPLRIFEVGFGTGLNAWLTLVWAEQNQIPVLYHTIEPFPLSEEIYSQLNYGDLDDGFFHYKPYLTRLHKMEWDKGAVVSEYFNMKKEKTTLEEVTLYPSDVVFFDAFAPSKQPELWEKQLLEKIYESMNQGGIFTTYCAQGKLKRDLKEIGFEVESLPGPPGKKEMTRGWKK